MRTLRNAFLCSCLASSFFTQRANGDESLPGKEPVPERRTYHLLVTSKAEAAKVRKEIVAAGGDRKAFRKAVRKHSKDPFTKPLGGDLGWLGRQDKKSNPGFLDAAFGLKIGAVSQAVETDFGWHLIFVEKERISKEEKTSTSDDKPEERPVAGPARAEAVVQRYLKVAGGVDSFRAIRDRTTRFKNVKHAATGESTARLALFLKRGYKFREEWIIENFQVKGKELSFTQIYDGDEGWVKMFDTVSPLIGRILAVFVWDKHLDDFFMHWKDDGYELTYEGNGKVEDQVVETVTATDVSGRSSVRYSFSKANGLLLKKEWQDTTQKDGKTLFKEQYYRKYEKVVFSDGSDRFLRVSKHHVIHTDGKLDTERTFEEVSFNTGLDDELFQRPEGKLLEEGTNKAAKATRKTKKL